MDGPSAATCTARKFDKPWLGVEIVVPLQLGFIHIQELASEHNSWHKSLNDNTQWYMEQMNGDFSSRSTF